MVLVVPVVVQVATFAAAFAVASWAVVQIAEDTAMPIAVAVSSAFGASVAEPLDNSAAQSE